MTYTVMANTNKNVTGMLKGPRALKWDGERLGHSYNSYKSCVYFCRKKQGY